MLSGIDVLKIGNRSCNVADSETDVPAKHRPPAANTAGVSLSQRLDRLSHMVRALKTFHAARNDCEAISRLTEVKRQQEMMP